MNFTEMAHKICKAVGGAENIVSVTHCATRFRVILVNDEKMDKEAVEAVEGVMGILKAGSQWQIVIGKDVAEFYQVFINEYHIEEGKKKKFNAKNLLADVGLYLQTAVGAMIVPLIGFAMIRAILTLLSTFGIADAANATYAFIWSCSEVGTYYMPVLLAYGAAKKLGCNPTLAIALGLMMVNPSYTAAITAGTEQTLFGITVAPYSFSMQFLPILIAVPVFAVIEKFLKKHTPEILSAIVVPTVSLLLMIPVIFLIIGPAMTAFSSFIVGPALWLAQYRYVVIPVMAMLWSILTLFGMHGAVYYVINLFYFTQFGYDPVCLTSYLCTHVSIGSVALMSAVLTEDKEKKAIGISSGISVLFAGISEPALFGVLVRDKRYYAAQLAAAFVSALYAGIAGVRNYVVGSVAALLYLPTYIGEGSTMFEVFITVAICMGASVFFSLLFTGTIKKKKAA